MQAKENWKNHVAISPKSDKCERNHKNVIPCFVHHDFFARTELDDFLFGVLQTSGTMGKSVEMNRANSDDFCFFPSASMFRQR